MAASRLLRRVVSAAMILWFLPFVVASTLLRWVADLFEAVGLFVYALADFVDHLGVRLTFGCSDKILRWVQGGRESD